MFKQLADAIALQIGFDHQLYLDGFTALTDGVAVRGNYFKRQVEELRKNSGFTTEAEYREITFDRIVEAVELKIWAQIQSGHADPATYVVVASDNPSYRLAKYSNRGARGHATRKAAKHNAAHRAAERAAPGAQPGPYFVVRSLRDHVRSKRAKLVRSIMHDRSWVMENTHTSWTSSVASETYWSA